MARILGQEHTAGLFGSRIGANVLGAVVAEAVGTLSSSTVEPPSPSPLSWSARWPARLLGAAGQTLVRDAPGRPDRRSDDGPLPRSYWRGRRPRLSQ
jgi:hypothetical protein